MIITNGVPRDFIDTWALTPTEREQFDYLDWAAIDAGEDSATFFRYRGYLYSMDQFMRGGAEGWDASLADSFFSGIVVKIIYGIDDQVIVGTWYA